MKARKKANEDMKKAEKAMTAVTDMVCSMGDNMVKEEQFLAVRADELRRQSIDIFKVRITLFEKCNGNILFYFAQIRLNLNNFLF